MSESKWRRSHRRAAATGQGQSQPAGISGGPLCARATGLGLGLALPGRAEWGSEHGPGEGPAISPGTGPSEMGRAGTVPRAARLASAWLSHPSHTARPPRREHGLNVSLFTGNCVCSGLNSISRKFMSTQNLRCDLTRRVLADVTEDQGELARDGGGAQGEGPCKRQTRPQADPGKRVLWRQRRESAGCVDKLRTLRMPAVPSSLRRERGPRDTSISECRPAGVAKVHFCRLKALVGGGLFRQPQEMDSVSSPSTPPTSSRCLQPKNGLVGGGRGEPGPQKGEEAASGLPLFSVRSRD